MKNQKKIKDWEITPIQITFNKEIKEKKHSEGYISSGFTKESWTGASHPNDGSSRKLY